VIQTLASDGLLDKEIVGVQMLGSDQALQWKRSSEGLTIQLPATLPDQPVIGFRVASE
jgi:alpha-L-fucosidase